METHTQINEWKAEGARLSAEYPIKPKVVYLASCYRSARCEHGVDQYIHEAGVLARKMWKLGLAVLCPVKNTAFFGGLDVPDRVWLLGDFVLLGRCDAIVMHPNAVRSTGAQEELRIAREIGLPVFHLPDQWRKLAAWAKGGNPCEPSATGSNTEVHNIS